VKTSAAVFRFPHRPDAPLTDADRNRIVAEQQATSQAAIKQSASEGAGRALEKEARRWTNSRPDEIRQALTATDKLVVVIDYAALSDVALDSAAELIECIRAALRRYRP